VVAGPRGSPWSPRCLMGSVLSNASGRVPAAVGSGGLDFSGVDEGGGVQEGCEVEVAGVAEVAQVDEELDEGLLEAVGGVSLGAAADLGVQVEGLGGVGGAVGVGLAGSGGAGGGVFTIGCGVG
jgi:hypothetical protein